MSISRQIETLPSIISKLKIVQLGNHDDDDKIHPLKEDNRCLSF